MLFLGCSLENDRTMQLFKTIMKQEDERKIPRHYAFLSSPEKLEDLIEKEKLVNYIWWVKSSLDVSDNTINVTISTLRKKLWWNFLLYTKWYRTHTGWPGADDFRRGNRCPGGGVCSFCHGSANQKPDLFGYGGLWTADLYKGKSIYSKQGINVQIWGASVQWEKPGLCLSSG